MIIRLQGSSSLVYGKNVRGGVPHNGLPIQGGSTHKGVSFSEPQEYERVEIFTS